MKKILLLGGSYGQLPAIKEANSRGYYTILCDYLPDNPGKKHVNKHYLVSTTDHESVLKVARDQKIDHVLAYASDPSALTAAYISEKMNLFGNTFRSSELLVKKDQFREFLRVNGFNTPTFYVFNKDEIKKLKSLNSLKIKLPVVVKPVDSSDTKGVTLANSEKELKEAIEYALTYSKAGCVIIEEFINARVANFHGDGFVMDGKLVFCALGDLLFTSISNPLKPSCTLYPSRTSPQFLLNAKNELNRAVELSGFKYGAINIEARINDENKFYIMEIGPRSGGSFTPQTIYHSTGFDMLSATFDWMDGKSIDYSVRNSNPAICFTLHANSTGVLDSIIPDDMLSKFIVEEHIYAKQGDRVKSYNSDGSSLGTYIFKFRDFEQVNPLLDQLYDRVIGGIKLMPCQQQHDREVIG